MRGRVTFSSNPFPPGCRHKIVRGGVGRRNGNAHRIRRVAFEGSGLPSIGMEGRVLPIRQQRAGRNLVADTEFDKNFLVTLRITVLQVGEESTPLGNHVEKASP